MAGEIILTPVTSLRRIGTGMYQTSCDILTHVEPWATVFRVGLAETCVRICGHLALPEHPEKFGVRVFDCLTTSQKIAMLARVGTALLDATSPAPRLTAVVEATTATILEVFVEELEVEADTNGFEKVRAEDGQPPISICRAAVLAIIGAGREDAEDDLPEVLSSDWETWQGLGESLLESILFDSDFEDEDIYMDLPPAEGAALKRRMSIIPEYFSETAPEPTRQELARHIATLERLTGERLDIDLVVE